MIFITRRSAAGGENDIHVAASLFKGLFGSKAIVFSGSRPSSFSTAMYCGAKASLTSTSAMSDTPMPARSRAIFDAGTGPMPITFGSQPETPQLTRRAMGCRPFCSAHFASATTRLAAPSQMPDALPAVTVPSFLNTGRSLPRDSGVDGRGRARPFPSARRWLAVVRPAGQALTSRVIDRRRRHHLSPRQRRRRHRSTAGATSAHLRGAHLSPSPSHISPTGGLDARRQSPATKGGAGRK